MAASSAKQQRGFAHLENAGHDGKSIDRWPYIFSHMLFAGWEVRMVKNCDRGLENAARGRRPRAAFSSPRSQFFTIRADPKPANNMFIFFSSTKLVLRRTNGFVYATLVIESACAPSTSDL